MFCPNPRKSVFNPLFSPGGEAKCVRGPSVQGARRSARGGVLEQYVEHGEQAQRSNGGPIACFDRQLVRNAGNKPRTGFRQADKLGTDPLAVTGRKVGRGVRSGFGSERVAEPGRSGIAKVGIALTERPQEHPPLQSKRVATARLRSVGAELCRLVILGSPTKLA